MILSHRVFDFKHKGTKTLCLFRYRKIQRAAKAALTKVTKFSLPQVHKVINPEGFVATFKSLVIFVSRNNPLFLCVFVFNS